jgi:hypothetical protein
MMISSQRTLRCGIRGLAARHGLLLAIALIPLVAGGCIYERVDILVGNSLYSGTILSHYSDVESTRSGLLLKPGARFAIKAESMTQLLGQFDVVIVGGQGMNVYMRTAPYKFDTTRGVAFRYAVDGCTIRTETGVVKPLNFNAETEQQTLSFYNEADRVAVSVGCRKLYEDQSSLPGTEYLIFETLPGSTVEIRSVGYFDTNLE